MNFQMEKMYHPYQPSMKNIFAKENYVAPYEKENRKLVKTQNITTNHGYRKYLMTNSEKIVQANHHLYKKLSE